MILHLHGETASRPPRTNLNVKRPRIPGQVGKTVTLHTVALPLIDRGHLKHELGPAGPTSVNAPIALHMIAQKLKFDRMAKMGNRILFYVMRSRGSEVGPMRVYRGRLSLLMRSVRR